VKLSEQEGLKIYYYFNEILSRHYSKSTHPNVELLQVTEMTVARLRRGTEPIKAIAINKLQELIAECQKKGVKPFTREFAEILIESNLVNLLFGPEYYNETVLLKAKAVVEFILNECCLGKTEVELWRDNLKNEGIAEQV